MSHAFSPNKGYHGYSRVPHHHHPCCCGAHTASQVVYVAPLCSGCQQPYQQCQCQTDTHLVREITVDPSSTPAEETIGGSAAVRLTLEYMPEDGATTPSIRFTMVGAGVTSTWAENPVPSGYHVKSDFPAVSPGAKVTVEVAEAIARLRWCEVINC